LKRRRFLQLSAAGAAAAAVGGPLWPRRGIAAAFGEFPREARGVQLPADLRAKRVLEIFLYGGLSPWESLYCVEEYGRPDDPEFPNTQLYTFGLTGPNSIGDALAACEVPPEAPLTEPFATDALGASVKLGPFAHGLRARPDLVDRMRIIVQSHDLEPHEAAIPLALTGKRVGQPSAAGLGAHVQRYFIEQGAAGRRSPFSYVMSTGGVPGDNVSAAAATGVHPGATRPLHIRITNAERLTSLLGRPAVGNLEERRRYDELLDVYVERYRQRLRWRGEGEPARSARLTEVAQAAVAVQNSDAVAAVMEDSLFRVVGGRTCGDDSGYDVPGMSLNAARHLLTHPTEAARYVCVSDTGLLEASGGGGYDTHTENSHDTARNFANVLKHLAAIINPPGETDPAKLDLDDTLVILNTEFGRTPWEQDGGNGRNHHPYGYATVFLGGPIRSEQRGVYGAIGPDGNAAYSASPSVNRVGALLALGIWPFSPEAFAVGDVEEAGSEAEAARFASERILGYTL
jgi:hypothetical protein